MRSTTAGAGMGLWLLADQLPADANRPLPAMDATERSELKKIVALLVEDNRADVLIIEEAVALQGLPIELHIVGDGEKAFEYIERAELDPMARGPQMLLVDLNLPKRTGKEVIQRIRQSPKCKDIPILVLTSSNSERDRKDVADLGVNDYFCKPSSYDEFLKVGHVLASLLKQRTT